jgi:hypothetical protein
MARGFSQQTSREYTSFRLNVKIFFGLFLPLFKARQAIEWIKINYFGHFEGNSPKHR